MVLTLFCKACVLPVGEYMPVPNVPIEAALSPIKWANWLVSCTVEVLPFVPVTAITDIESAGN